jgi:hypothetical protein
MPASNRAAHADLAALVQSRPIASPEATLFALLHVLEGAVEEAERIGLAQTADGLGALSRFCLAEYRTRHGLAH